MTLLQWAELFQECNKQKYEDIKMISLKDKIVFITGASSGIGEATAIEFAKLGTKLLLVARREDRLKNLSQALKNKYGTNCLHINLDVRHQKSVQKSIDNLPDEWKNIDILINNAGLSRGLDKAHEADIQDWEEMIDTNIKGLLYVTRAILPMMVKRNHGHIVNLGSVASHSVYPGGNVYCATKHAVKCLCDAFRMDLFGTNIRVTCISPGMVNTEFSTVRYHGDKSKADKVYEGMTPLSAEDIADTIIYSCTRPEHVNISEIFIMPTAQSAVQMVNRKI